MPADETLFLNSAWGGKREKSARGLPHSRALAAKFKTSPANRVAKIVFMPSQTEGRKKYSRQIKWLDRQAAKTQIALPRMARIDADTNSAQNHVMVKKKKLSCDEIHAMRGRIKFNTGGKSFVEWMADLNGEEKELEDAKLIRMIRTGLFAFATNSNRSKRKTISTG